MSLQYIWYCSRLFPGGTLWSRHFSIFSKFSQATGRDTSCVVSVLASVLQSRLVLSCLNQNETGNTDPYLFMHLMSSIMYVTWNPVHLKILLKLNFLI